MAVQPGLCRNWLKTLKTDFLMMQLICKCVYILKVVCTYVNDPCAPFVCSVVEWVVWSEYVLYRIAIIQVKYTTTAICHEYKDMSRLTHCILGNF